MSTNLNSQLQAAADSGASQEPSENTDAVATINSIEVVSFGYKYGFPENATLLFDVRFLENPHYDLGLRALTGADAPVQKFIEAQPASRRFFETVKETVAAVLPGYLANRQRYGKIVIAFGCTGGKHRSRYYAIKTAEFVEELVHSQSLGLSVSLSHRDEGKE